MSKRRRRTLLDASRRSKERQPSNGRDSSGVFKFVAAVYSSARH